MGIEILEYEEDGLQGFDLRVTDERVTVQDYLDAVNEFILEGVFARIRKPVADCEGCSGCCSERIPITSVDLNNMMGAPHIREILKKEPKLKNTLEEFCQITVEGRSVDIILERDSRGRCRFLDKGLNLCKIYQYRPLVCQTFICCPQSTRAQKLREQIVNIGEDQLVHLWIKDSRDSKEPLLFHDAYNPDLRFDDWRETTFNNNTYKNILIKDICPAELWDNLRV